MHPTPRARRARPQTPPKALLILALAASAACTHYKVVKDGEVNQRAMRRVEERTAHVRGLPFKGPVDAVVYTKKDSAEYFAQEMSEADKEVARRQDMVAHRLGLLPDGRSLADLFQQALSNNAAGVYQPPTGVEAEAAAPPRGRLFIVPDALPRPVRVVMGGFGYLTGTDWTNELFLSHELMHALQDQHFDLNRVLPAGLYGSHEDMAIARKSVVESEANLVAQAYLLGVDLDSVVQRNLLIEYLAFGRVFDVWTTRLMNPDLPPFYAKVLVEQYTQGMEFLQHVTNRGGWKAINRAYAESLPRSTEQLMDPDKLFGEHPDPPRYLAMLPEKMTGDLEGYARIESNVFGKLLWRIYLEDYMLGAATVADGWGGDRYEVLEKDGSSLLVWRTLWDTEVDAMEFAAAYPEVLQGKYPGRVTLHTRDEGLEVWDIAPKTEGPETPGVRTSDDEVAVVLRRGDAVLAVEGLTTTTWRQAVDALTTFLVEDPSAEPDLPAGSSAALAAAELDFVRPQPPPLKERVFLPHHRMAFRFGLGGLFDHASEPGAVRASLALDREFRWGFRQRLEWTPPYLLSIELLNTDHFQTVVTSGFAELGIGLSDRGLYVQGQPILLLTQAVHATPWLAGVTQLGVETQLTSDPRFAPAFTVLGNVALYGALGDRVVGSMGVGYRAGYQVTDLLAKPRLVDPVLVLGAATARGRPIMPTLEVRLIDGLHLYEASQVFIDPLGLRLLGHRHVAGLLLYF